MATKLRNIRVSDERWERWQALAAKNGVTVTDLITDALDALSEREPAFTELLTRRTATKFSGSRDVLAKQDVKTDFKKEKK